MTKIITLLMFGLLLLNVQTVSARESIGDVANFDTKYEHENIENYDFDAPVDENSFYISDEQVKSVSDDDDATVDPKHVEGKMTFWQRIINTGHFSSNTATKTWIPVNRVE